MGSGSIRNRLRTGLQGNLTLWRLTINSGLLLR